MLQFLKRFWFVCAVMLALSAVSSPAAAACSGPYTGNTSGTDSDAIRKALNDIFGAETRDDDQLHFATGITQRLLRQDDLMAQVNSHSVDQVMHGLLPKRMVDTVLDAITCKTVERVEQR